MEIKDRVALVAGAATEVGSEIGRMFARNGALVVLADKNQDTVTAIEREIKADGGKAKACVMNMMDESDIDRIIRLIVGDFGTIDVLINCMDSEEKHPVSGTTMEQWKSLIDENLTSVLLVTQAVLPIMKQKAFGRIVNLSDFDYLGMPGRSSYSAVKSGLFGFTRGLALELAAEGITVNAVVKGELNSKRKEMTEDQLTAAGKRMPVGRIGTMEDMAYAVSHFASASSKYITGQTLFVCGGKSLYASMSV